MNTPRTFLLLLSIACSSLSHAQNKITVLDFESPLHVGGWWVDNKQIILSQCDPSACDQLPGSGKCLRIQWDPVPSGRPSTWLTDIKIDTFGNPKMAGSWKNYAENAWLSFSLNTAAGDSIYLQFIVFTKDEKDKWGSREMIGFRSPDWKTVKVRLSSLHYANWGKGNMPAPDLNAIVPARIEIGIRSAGAGQKGKIDLRVDDIAITNYEP